AKAEQLSMHLRNEGVKKNDVVGLIIDRSIDMIIGLLSIMKSGATYLPIDPLFPKTRIEYMLQDSSTGLVLCSKKYNREYNCEAKFLSIEDLTFIPEGLLIQVVEQVTES